MTHLATYTLAGMETKTILHLEIVDVREVEERKVCKHGENWF